jgi:hypothetical protein
MAWYTPLEEELLPVLRQATDSVSGNVSFVELDYVNADIRVITPAGSTRRSGLFGHIDRAHRCVGQCVGPMRRCGRGDEGARVWRARMQRRR